MLNVMVALVRIPLDAWYNSYLDRLKWHSIL